MNIKLVKLNHNIGDDEYMMYQEIPKEEYGAINNLNGVQIEIYEALIKERIDEEFVKLDSFNTPRITYIMYVDNYPVGEIAIRPVLNAYWKDNSGNIGYKIRPSMRNKGYGSKMLSLALIECRKLGLDSIELHCFKDNIASKRVMIKNNAKLIRKDKNVEVYEIIL